MKKIIALLAIAYFSTVMLFVYVALQHEDSMADNADANDILYTIEKSWPDIEGAMNKLSGYDLSYVVLDSRGEIIAKSDAYDGTDDTYRYQYINRDYRADVNVNGELVCRIVFINKYWETYRNRVLVSIGVCSLFLMAVSLILIRFIYINYHQPIEKVNELAAEIGNGNYPGHLDYRPEELGVFSKGITLMKDELESSRKKEMEADKNLREIVATISHDIKNPIASIRSTAELQMMITPSEELKEELQRIIEKTIHISEMVVNLHKNVVDDLGGITIHKEMLPSEIIKEICIGSDYKKRVCKIDVPECLIQADRNALRQIMENILYNSYKYADTPIEVTGSFQDEYLSVSFKDSGKGVSDDELVFLTKKFYRGENAKGVEGSGIGMYIAEVLMKKMSGKIVCKSLEGVYFEVVLYIELAV